MTLNKITDFSNLEQLTESTINNINRLPPTELRYYLFLLVAELHNEKKSNKYFILLSDLNELTISINSFYRTIKSEKSYEELDAITVCLNTLVKHAKRYPHLLNIQKILLNIIASITAIIIGITGASLGTAIGLFSQWNILKGAYLGFMSGLGVGFIIGFHIPEKLAFSSWEAKLNYTLERLIKVSDELHNIQKKMITYQNPINNLYFSPQYNIYENTAKKYILDTFFKDEKYPTLELKENAFRVFLQSEQCFEVCTTQNGFIDRSLKGNLGNHAFIRYKINNIEAPAMEFGSRTRYPHWVDQKETLRKVRGQKLFEMIALDIQLQETHKMGFQFLINSFRVGDNDCFTYVNKILLGTQQKPTIVKRFSEPTDTWIGSHIVSNLFTFFIKKDEHEIERIVPFLEDDQSLEVCTFKRK